jgi:hypothetical protein
MGFFNLRNSLFNLSTFTLFTLFTLLPFTFRLFTFYLLPFTFYLLPFTFSTFYLLPFYFFTFSLFHFFTFLACQTSGEEVIVYSTETVGGASVSSGSWGEDSYYELADAVHFHVASSALTK